MPDDSRSIANSAPMFLTLAVGAGLLAAALWRWPENGWNAWVWLGAFLATVVIRMPHSLRARANVVVAARKGMDERILLALMFATMMLLPLTHLATGVFAFADHDAPAWVAGVGAALQAPHLWLFWRSHADLGRNWSPGLEVRRDHALVTGGIYARVRHPMYAAIWCGALSQALLIPNWIAGFLALPAFAAMWFIRVPREEALMRERFGDAYAAYAARTGRLWPRWAR